LECNQNTEGTLRGRKAHILIAGCGSGREAAVLATVFPDATITAVDLSRSSLAYAAAQARKHSLSNILFRHGDILRLKGLEDKFDYVSATGVLHHMEDPIEGWKVCSGLLKQDGLMRIGLYSETGRGAVVAARRAIQKGNYQPNEIGMRNFRRDSSKILNRETLLALANFRDYYHMNMYRDLLFHVQEHRFSIPQIESILAELGLSFEGFYLSSDVFEQYSQMFPEDPRKTRLENWHKFEQENPETFMNMYFFWCRKSPLVDVA
jgi:SAM-dependent methyltransferase